MIDIIPDDDTMLNPLLSKTPGKPMGKTITEMLNESKKTEETLSQTDKINAIYEMLPIITEAHNICQFMLENR